MRRFFALCLLAVCGSTTYASGVVIGATREDVLAAFGEPVGRSSAGAREVWTYSDGTVALRDGKVEFVDAKLKERIQEIAAAEMPNPVKAEPAPKPASPPVTTPETGFPGWIKKALMVIFLGVFFILGRRWMRVATAAEKAKTNAPFIR